MISFVSNLSWMEIAIFIYMYVFCGWHTQQARWYRYGGRTRWHWRLLVGAGWPVTHIFYAFLAVIYTTKNALSERREAKRKAIEHARRAPHVS